MPQLEPKCYEFPTCLHGLATALHMEGVSPGDVEIVMPFEAWWALWHALERKCGGIMTFDGRHSVPGEFKYLGFKFVNKSVQREKPK